MPKIISFISRKGGTGKTTNAINLATALHESGKKVLLVETDTNYTLNTLRKMEQMRGEVTGGSFEILGSEDHQVADELIKIKQNSALHYVIIDSAGKTTDEGIKKLCLVSDAVIVPTSLTQNDLLVTYQTVMDLAPAQSLNPNLKIMVLPNRIHSFTSMKTVHESLSNVDAIILDVRVPQKNLFVNFSTVTGEKEIRARDERNIEAPEMSKNKNPLKDLDLFLKQQAASFVNPTPLSEKIQTEETPVITSSSEKTEETILQSIERLIEQNPNALYDMLIQASEKKNSSERTVLINTALYLKNTKNWKEAIREYWSKK